MFYVHYFGFYTFCLSALKVPVFVLIRLEVTWTQESQNVLQCFDSQQASLSASWGWMCADLMLFCYSSFNDTYVTLLLTVASENEAKCGGLCIYWIIKPQKIGTSLNQTLWGEGDTVWLVFSSDQALLPDSWHNWWKWELCLLVKE